MAKATPIKVSFNAGELTPLLDGRTDQAKYFNGCSIIEGFMPTVQGPLVRRGGFYFANEVKSSVNRTWLKGFIFNVNQSYMLEFGNQYIRFFTNRGVVLESNINIITITNANPCQVSSFVTPYATGDYIYISGVAGMTQLNGKFYKIVSLSSSDYTLQDTDGNPVDSTAFGAYTGGGTVARIYQVATPYTAADLTDSDGNFRLGFEQSGNVLYVFHPSYVPKKLTRAGATSWALSDVVLSKGPFKDINSDSAITVLPNAETGAVTLTATGGNIFEAGHVGSYFYLEQSINTDVLQWEPAKAVLNNARRRSGVNNYIAVGNGTCGTVKPNHTVGRVYDGDSGVNWEYTDSGYGIVKITGYTSPTVVTGTIIGRLPFGTLGSSSANTTYLWAHSLFSSVEGWPERGRVFRERLALSKGTQLALSVAGDYENFASKIDGEVTADAGIRIALPTSNSVRWMMEGDDLIVGTGGDELAVGEITSSDPLGPTNIRARSQTSFGSRAIEPVKVGATILFITRSGQRLREIKYAFESNGYVSDDLTVLSEHIAKGSDSQQSISQLAYQQEPFSIVWACTTDGKLLGFTISREQDVLAWHRHPVGGNGIVESVASIPSPDGKRDDLWCITRRTINGVTRRYVEWLYPEFNGTDANISDAFYVDCGLTYSGASATVITGLGHLKGQTVDILANGGSHAQKVVALDGTVTLDAPATKAQIGLPCPAKVRTMRIDAGSQLGTAQGKVKRIERILLRLLRALGGKYGPNDANMDELIYREGGAPMDTPPALKNGDSDLPWPDGYTTEGYIQITNDSPMPMTIITIVAKVETYD